MHKNRGRPREELSEEKKDWMVEFLSRSDMTYINPGCQDNVYIGKVDVERKYLCRQYLLWTLKDLLDMINGIELHSSNFVSTFLEMLSFSQLNDFIKSHKRFVYNKNIPHTSCLCDTCENVVLLAKSLNNYNDSQLQLVFLKHRMISLKNTAVHLMTKTVCLMIVQNVHLENYTNYLIPTLIQNLICILILIPIQAA